MAYPESVSDEAKVLADYAEQLAGENGQELLWETARLFQRRLQPRELQPCGCWEDWHRRKFKCTTHASTPDEEWTLRGLWR